MANVGVARARGRHRSEAGPVAVAVTLATGRGGPDFLYRVPLGEGLGVELVVTGRRGGFSTPPYDGLNLATHVGDRAEDVKRNRELVARALNVETVQFVRQVHGARVLYDNALTATSEGDAVMSADGRRATAILVADCVPIALVDPATTRFALVHAGWRGLAAGVLDATLRQFPDPGRVVAFVGPSISPRAYQVGPEVARHFAHVDGALREDVADRHRLDLRRVTSHQLISGGLADDNLIYSRDVTDGGDLFFSDRAQRPTGRFALIARRAVT